MKTSIETISGELCTVIKRPFDAKAVRKSLAMGVPVMGEDKREPSIRFVLLYENESGFYSPNAPCVYYDSEDINNTLTILPALPKYPKPEDAALLYRYASEGFFVWGTAHDGAIYPYGLDMSGIISAIGKRNKPEITHAVDADGNQVKVAIEGE